MHLITQENREGGVSIKDVWQGPKTCMINLLNVANFKIFQKYPVAMCPILHSVNIILANF